MPYLCAGGTPLTPQPGMETKHCDPLPTAPQRVKKENTTLCLPWDSCRGEKENNVLYTLFTATHKYYCNNHHITPYTPRASGPLSCPPTSLNQTSVWAPT